MCGRFRRKTAPTWRELFDYYSVLPTVRDQIDEEDVSGEVKPTDAVPIMAHRHGERRLTMARWWLVPRYLRDLNKLGHMFNARSETLLREFEQWRCMPQNLQANASHPYLRPFLEGRRCLMPVSGYYEFKDGRPYLFTLEGREVFSVAGIWEWNAHIKTPDWSGGILSCAMITTAPNAQTAEYHNRMPAILSPEQYDEWLSPDADLHQTIELLRPYNRDDMRIQACKPVSDDNSPRFL